jgi:uncharacterized protein YutE (UPF0331/DUF86 family)
MQRARAGAMARRIKRIQDKMEDDWSLDMYEDAVQRVLVPAYDRISDMMRATAGRTGDDVDRVLSEAEELVRETEEFVDEMISRRRPQ